MQPLEIVAIILQMLTANPRMKVASRHGARTTSLRGMEPSSSSNSSSQEPAKTQGQLSRGRLGKTTPSGSGRQAARAGLKKVDGQPNRLSGKVQTVEGIQTLRMLRRQLKLQSLSVQNRVLAKKKAVSVEIAMTIVAGGDKGAASGVMRILRLGVARAVGAEVAEVAEVVELEEAVLVAAAVTLDVAVVVVVEVNEVTEVTEVTEVVASGAAAAAVEAPLMIGWQSGCKLHRHERRKPCDMACFFLSCGI